MTEEQNVPDFENMSLEELENYGREDAQRATQLETPAEETPEQPRDERGRFVKKEEDAPAETQQSIAFRREIDLGDGAGKQVFEGATWEELADKLANAQLHASKKIREQNERLRQLEAKKQEEESRYDADKEFILTQELMTRPSEAIKTIFRNMTGYDITEFKTVAERVRAYEAAESQKAAVAQQEAAAAAFVESHPEYISNASNGQRLVKAVNLLAHEAKVNGEEIDYPTLLEKAYQDLSESGLLQLKSNGDVTTVGHEPTEAAPSRIARTDDVVQPQRRRGSSLASRGSVAAPAQKTEPTLEDLYTMPLEQLEELARRRR